MCSDARRAWVKRSWQRKLSSPASGARAKRGGQNVHGRLQHFQFRLVGVARRVPCHAPSGHAAILVHCPGDRAPLPSPLLQFDPLTPADIGGGLDRPAPVSVQRGPGCSPQKLCPASLIPVVVLHCLLCGQWLRGIRGKIAPVGHQKFCGRDQKAERRQDCPPPHFMGRAV